MKTHIIENGVVTNTIVATVEEAQVAFPSATCIEATEGGIGWLYNGTALVPPVIEQVQDVLTIPSSVSMRQARLALLEAGLLDDVTTAITQLGQAAAIEWEYAAEVRRDSPLIALVASNNSLTEQQIDDLFVSAAGK